MYIQWCVKGISAGPVTGIDDKAVLEMLNGGKGIWCNWWRNQGGPQSPADTFRMLNDANLERHVNNYSVARKDTPFISVAAGAVERHQFLTRNVVYPAIDTALSFATDYNKHPGYIFYCWVLVGIKKAPELKAFAEEVRDLNLYQRWSRYQLQGELTAKIEIPTTQIERVEKWIPGKMGAPNFDREFKNPHFVAPERISNVRGLF